MDFAWMNQAADAVNGLRHMDIVQGSKSTGQVHVSDGNTVIELPAQVKGLFPFCVYAVPNNTASADQRALFAAQKISIDNLTFQIRGGLLGCRPYINEPLFNTDWPIGQAVGNYELDIEVLNTDSTENFYDPPSNNTGSSATCALLDNINPTLICGIPDGSPAYTDIVYNQQVALNPNPDSGIGVQPNARNAAFWMEIVDDPNNQTWGNVYANLWGCMYSADPDSDRVQWPIPNGTNIVPLAAVRTYYPGDAGSLAFTSVFQILPGNLVNRFPPGLTTLRGKWSAIFAALPAGHTQLFFYPGDQVIDDTNSIVWNGGNIYGIYQYNGTAPIQYLVGAAPVNSIADWVQIGMYPN